MGPFGAQQQDKSGSEDIIAEVFSALCLKEKLFLLVAFESSKLSKQLKIMHFHALCLGAVCAVYEECQTQLCGNALVESV